MYEVKDKQTNKQTVLHWPAYTSLMLSGYCTALYCTVLSLVHYPSSSFLPIDFFPSVFTFRQFSVFSIRHSVSPSIRQFPVSQSVFPSVFPSDFRLSVMYQLSVSPSVSHSVSQSVSPVLPSVLPSCTNQSFPWVCRQLVRLFVRLMSVSSPVSPSVSHTNLNKLNININKAKAISAELLKLNLKITKEEMGKTRWNGNKWGKIKTGRKTSKTKRTWIILKKQEETGRNMRHGAKNVWHGAKNVRHGGENVRHGAENVWYGVRKVYQCVRKVYHCVRKVYHGVKQVYHSVSKVQSSQYRLTDRRTTWASSKARVTSECQKCVARPTKQPTMRI